MFLEPEHMPNTLFLPPIDPALTFLVIFHLCGTTEPHSATSLGTALAS